MADSIRITPETKLAILLEQCPQLEETLLTLSPAFAKLQNPLLRRTVAKIATLRQVAQVGNVSLAELINHLRAAVGQERESFAETETEPKPAWLKAYPITATLDARPILAAGEHPLAQVLTMLKNFPQQAVFELITPFVPAPLLDQVRDKGFEIYSETVAPELVKNYFCRKADDDKAST